MKNKHDIMSKKRYVFNDTNISKLYITSDTHFGHKFLAKTRQYSSIEEHDNNIINIINQTCNQNDTILFLGDFVKGLNELQFFALCDKILANKWVILGNHDKLLKRLIYSKPQYDLIPQINVFAHPIYQNTWVLGNYLELWWNQQFCVFTHYPFSIWNKSHHASWNLCGHSHYQYPISTASNLESKQLDCGWDGHLRPLSFLDIKNIMTNKRISIKDSHVPRTR